MPRFAGVPVEDRAARKPRFAGVPLDITEEAQRLAAQDTSAGEALLVGIGEGLTSTYRGAKQILGIDEEEMRNEAAAIRALRAEHPAATVTGSVIGNIADPVNLIPMGKAASVAGLAGRGAVGGTVAGGLGYVDEEGGQTRLGNAALGTAFGTAAGTLIGGGINAARKLRGRELLPLFPRSDADTAIRAGVVPAPGDGDSRVAGLLEYKPRAGETLYATPEGRVGTKAQIDEAQASALRERYAPQPAGVPRKPPREPVTIDATRAQPQADPDLARAVEAPGVRRTADQVADAARPPRFKGVPMEKAPGGTSGGEGNQQPLPHRPSPGAEGSVQAGGTGGNGTGTVSFLGTGQVGKALRDLANVYQRYAGRPLLELLQRNPGSALGGVGGSAAGYQSADEDAPMTEKLGRAAAGFALGVTGAKAIGKIPIGGGENVSELLSRYFVDNHGLPTAYVDAKKARQILTSQIASDFLDVAREAQNLGPGQRQRLYRMLQGEAPKAGELLPLNDRVREKVTRWGQRMVDYGLLDAETFRRNAATYLHREYASKLNPASETGQKIARQIRMLGEELRPRGILKEVSEKEAADWAAKGGSCSASRATAGRRCAGS